MSGDWEPDLAVTSAAVAADLRVVPTIPAAAQALLAAAGPSAFGSASSATGCADSPAVRDRLTVSVVAGSIWNGLLAPWTARVVPGDSEEQDKSLVELALRLFQAPMQSS